VQGISSDPQALGFFGVAYYEENKAKLKLVGVDDGKAENGGGCVTPTTETVENGTYQPLSRPLFIYVKKSAADRPEIKAFVQFFLTNAPTLVQEVGYVPFKPDAYELVQRRFEARTTGSLFGGKGSQVGVTIAQLLAKEGAD
jgi:phosphate transport system substrate-binding protein